MGKDILILGAGFGGLACANILRKNLTSEHRITVIDKKKSFMMGFVNLWILYGIRSVEESHVPLERLKNKNIEFINDEITGIDINNRYTITKKNHNKNFDYLVIALGAELAPERVKGFVENGFNLYDVEHIPGLRNELSLLKSGRVAICIMGMPYKCPPAPFEASMLISDMLIKNGTRENIDIDIYSPAEISLPAAGNKASEDLTDIIKKHDINFHPLHRVNTIKEKQIEFANGNSEEYDLLVGIPPHTIPQVIRDSGLANNKEWINVDRYTLKTNHKNIFAVGDITEIMVNEKFAVPKAGIFAEGQAKAAAAQIINDITGNQDDSFFDGRGYCFIETGNRMAGYIDVDLYGASGPMTRIDPPTYESYVKKQEFEKIRIQNWL